MTMVEYFSFLPYGKYAFYVWLAYGVATLTVIFLFIVARKNHSSALNSLKNKYSRGNDQKTKPYDFSFASSTWSFLGWLFRH